MSSLEYLRAVFCSVRTLSSKDVIDDERMDGFLQAFLAECRLEHLLDDEKKTWNRAEQLSFPSFLFPPPHPPESCDVIDTSHPLPPPRGREGGGMAFLTQTESTAFQLAKDTAEEIASRMLSQLHRSNIGGFRTIGRCLQNGDGWDLHAPDETTASEDKQTSALDLLREWPHLRLLVERLLPHYHRFITRYCTKLLDQCLAELIVSEEPSPLHRGRQLPSDLLLSGSSSDQQDNKGSEVRVKGGEMGPHHTLDVYSMYRTYACLACLGMKYYRSFDVLKPASEIQLGWACAQILACNSSTNTSKAFSGMGILGPAVTTREFRHFYKMITDPNGRLRRSCELMKTHWRTYYDHQGGPAPPKKEAHAREEGSNKEKEEVWSFLTDVLKHIRDFQPYFLSVPTPLPQVASPSSSESSPPRVPLTPPELFLTDWVTELVQEARVVLYEVAVHPDQPSSLLSMALQLIQEMDGNSLFLSERIFPLPLPLVVRAPFAFTWALFTLSPQWDVAPAVQQQCMKQLSQVSLAEKTGEQEQASLLPPPPPSSLSIADIPFLQKESGADQPVVAFQQLQELLRIIMEDIGMFFQLMFIEEDAQIIRMAKTMDIDVLTKEGMIAMKRAFQDKWDEWRETNFYLRHLFLQQESNNILPSYPNKTDVEEKESHSLQ
mmetsp:Transcript_39971/g.103136  ORF Transcript_39971/g.103136 Transcript_39971/m.103136 type:complete len:662 (-) Transcript_39971:2178-4163(-)|eukprot:CAMPEP_0113909216 /NCGR_PEP_ID=MMETSP0780_2-20120614/26687_1 /TAXON_ID=652834 /ORGANISM="Palpitomonas bilix" /LENGTH=661 /DNA_ID=CAMNT_0000904917 /DNA_START=751 /DNA_END=2736 /DNA_ORIENTATION=+ /assembly_acc=CAM_ASM_000599